LATTPDGRYLAAGGSKGTIYIWDLEADRLKHTLPDAGRGLPIYILNFTPDGKRLVSQAHLFPSARVWDVASGRELTSRHVADSNIGRMLFSADGKALATSGQRDSVQLWDIASGKLLRRFEQAESLTRRFDPDSFALSPSGKAVVTAHHDEAIIWNLADASLRHRIKAPVPKDTPDKDARYFSLTSCSPDDDTIVAIFSGDLRQVVPGKRRFPDRKIYWSMIGIVDGKTGRVQRSFRVEGDYQSHVCLSPDRRLLAAIESSLRVWDLERGVELFHSNKLSNRGGWESLAFSADSRTVLLTSTVLFGDKWVYAFQAIEIASGRARASFVHVLDPKMNHPRGAMASDHLAGITKGATISLFDPLTGKEFGRLRTMQDNIGCLAFSPDGKRCASAGHDTTALIWDIADLVPAPATTRLAEADMGRCWADLLSPNAESPFRAIRQMVQARDQTVAYLAKQAQPVPPIPAGKIKTLVGQLDSPRFTERDQAERALLQLPELAEPALAEAGKNPVSEEARRRIQKLLTKLQEMKTKGPWTLSGERLREWRAVEVLERIGTSEAHRLLERLAKGAPRAILTRQAATAAQRLGKRNGQ
jgi:WD40 repeat protein